MEKHTYYYRELYKNNKSALYTNVKELPRVFSIMHAMKKASIHPLLGSFLILKNRPLGL